VELAASAGMVATHTAVALAAARNFLGSFFMAAPSLGRDKPPCYRLANERKVGKVADYGATRPPAELDKERPMHALKSILVAAGLAVVVPAYAAGTVEVTFTSPEKYTDAGPTAGEVTSTTRALQAHFEDLAKRLPDGQVLTIDVQDVDLAGEMRPSRQGRDLRVLNGNADWPRMTLSYTLTAGGKVVSSGIERLSDMDYMRRSRPLDSRELSYERRMIDSWFEQAVLGAKPAA